MAEILVCDDDKDIVEAIEIYLAQEGHHILKAYDGEQAIRVLQNNPVDLYTKNLYAYEDEVEVLRQVMATGIPCNVQTIPDDVPQELSKVLG